MKDLMQVNRLPAMTPRIRRSMCFDPVTTAVVVLGAATAATAGASAYSAHEQGKAAKKAAEAQKEVGIKQIEASLEAPKLAAEAARTKLRAKQAGATQTILTAPGGMAQTAANVNQPTILGVPS